MEDKLCRELKKIIPRRLYRETGNGGIFSCSFISGKTLNGKAENVCFKDFVILYLLRGKGRYMDFRGKEHELLPGTLALRIPDAPHSIYRYRKNEWLEFAMRLPALLYETLIDFCVIDKDLTFAEPGLNIGILKKLRSFMEYLNTPENTAMALPESIELLRLLCKDKKSKEPGGDSGNLSENMKIEQASRLLEKDFTRKISARQVAKELGMGYESFRKKFTEIKGCSPINYRINMKLEKARLLLSEPELQIKEISNILGYADISDFSRQFKKFAGVPPSCFRKG